MINFATSTPSGWDSPEQLKVREAGLPGPPPPPVNLNDPKQLPPGGGEWPVPPHLGFVSLIGMGWRAHAPYSDEALRHSRSNADKMLNDGLIDWALRKRLRPTSQLSWHIEPMDESDNAQMRAAAKVTLAISKTWKLQEAFYQLNHAKWYGKYALQLLWEFDNYQPDLVRVRHWSPLQGDSLIPRFAYNSWGCLVNSQFEGPTEPYALGRVHWFSDAEMESLIVSTYNSRQSDYFDGLSSGALRGQGLRNSTYWLWYLRANILSLLTDYIERLSAGVWKGYYDSSNAQARQDLEEAVAAYKSKHLLSLPKHRDGSVPNDLVIMEVGSASPTVMMNAIDYLDRLIVANILEQTPPSGSIGGDEVAMREGEVTGTTKADAMTLAEDLTENWLPTLYRYNAPGVPAGRFVFDTDHPNADRLLQYATVLMDRGYSVDLDHLAEICGVRKGGLNATIGTKIQSLSPTAVAAPPEGTPVAGTTPPEQQPAQSPPPQQAPAQAPPPPPSSS